MSAYLGKKQSIEPGFPLNEDQIEILDEGFRLDVATTPTTPPFGRSTDLQALIHDPTLSPRHTASS
jgi:hypothetical protein